MFQITTYKVKKPKVETIVKEIGQQLLDFIIIDLIKIEQEYSSDEEIINLTMTPITSSYFNKTPVSWELLHRHLLHPSGIFMKKTCRHQTLAGLPKTFPNKLNQRTCKICYTSKMTTITKLAKVDITNLRPG